MTLYPRGISVIVCFSCLWFARFPTTAALIVVFPRMKSSSAFGKDVATTWICCRFFYFFPDTLRGETQNNFQTLSFWLRKQSRARRWRRRFEHSVFLTVSINQSWEGSVNSKGGETFSPSFSPFSCIIIIPLLHSNTSVNCMHFSFFFLFMFFSFGAIVSVLSLNFSSFFAL